MAKETSKLSDNTSTQNAEPDQDIDDIFEDGEYAVSEVIEKEALKTDARRRIEIYWEKKQLKDQFDDFDESEFGF
ncbi:PA3496 family putative envelope integrity protein [Crenothrix polyspora]|jgi:hypothetical protein|uniref:Uncharacterized protein n=1 Tax=Crenothrix polyspora TaxID=360316 RepID=A0A1R4HBT9_9GAMM|nr:hypothetical protein [Crenothrix polyspora]SJM93718.1 conserved hypothetical protein [Crenothrix polyspora]